MRMPVAQYAIRPPMTKAARKSMPGCWSAQYIVRPQMTVWNSFMGRSIGAYG